VEYTNSALVILYQSWIYVTGTGNVYGTEAAGNVDLGPLRSVAAPDIDPTTSGSALTLLLAALAVLRGRRRATVI